MKYKKNIIWYLVLTVIALLLLPVHLFKGSSIGNQVGSNDDSTLGTADLPHIDDPRLPYSPIRPIDTPLEDTGVLGFPTTVRKVDQFDYPSQEYPVSQIKYM